MCRLAAEPQGVLTGLTEAAIFLVLTVNSGGEDQIRDLLTDVSGLRRSVGFRGPESGLSCVAGIAEELWRRLFGDPRPAGLHPFPELAGPRHTAVGTPGDLLFHIRANRLDLCFELAGQLVTRMGGCATVIDEVHGFRSFDQRDLLGFVDGTENPEGAAALEAVLIGDEDPEFAGGSYAVVQSATRRRRSVRTSSACARGPTSHGSRSVASSTTSTQAASSSCADCRVALRDPQRYLRRTGREEVAPVGPRARGALVCRRPELRRRQHVRRALPVRPHERPDPERRSARLRRASVTPAAGGPGLSSASG